jgi:hypothetical protein
MLRRWGPWPLALLGGRPGFPGKDKIMLKLKGLVGPQNGAEDASIVSLRCGNEAQVIIQQLHGPYYEMVIRGMVFIASSAVAGVALPVYDATAQKFMLWNPSDSGVNLELLCAAFGRVSTTGSDGHPCWGYKTGMGSAIATGAPCSAFTAGRPVIARLTLQHPVADNVVETDPTSKFAPATATVTAPGYLRPSCITQTEAADAQIYAPYMIYEDFSMNPIVLAPGSAIFACQSVAASTVWSVALTYARVPI